jgi:hypothetical protein
VAYFFFHLQFSERLLKDDVGSDFPNLPAAKREARATARDMLVEAIKFKHKMVPDAVVIADSSGRTLHTLPLTAVLPEPLKK